MATIQENIDRLVQAKAEIKSAFASKGINIPDNTRIEDYSDYASQFEDVNLPEPEYGVCDDITEYIDNDFTIMYDKATSKFVAHNSDNEYEDYGVTAEGTEFTDGNVKYETEGISNVPLTSVEPNSTSSGSYDLIDDDKEIDGVHYEIRAHIGTSATYVNFTIPVGVESVTFGFYYTEIYNRKVGAEIRFYNLDYAYPNTVISYPTVGKEFSTYTYNVEDTSVEHSSTITLLGKSNSNNYSTIYLCIPLTVEKQSNELITISKYEGKIATVDGVKYEYRNNAWSVNNDAEYKVYSTPVDSITKDTLSDLKRTEYPHVGQTATVGDKTYNYKEYKSYAWVENV